MGRSNLRWNWQNWRKFGSTYESVVYLIFTYFDTLLSYLCYSYKNIQIQSFNWLITSPWVQLIGTSWWVHSESSIRTVHHWNHEFWTFHTASCSSSHIFKSHQLNHIQQLHWGQLSHLCICLSFATIYS